MLTDQENTLLTNRDWDFISLFHEIDGNPKMRPDVPLLEMAQSESKSKFALAMATHHSITLQRGTNIEDRLQEAGFHLAYFIEKSMLILKQQFESFSKREKTKRGILLRGIFESRLIKEITLLT